MYTFCLSQTVRPKLLPGPTLCGNVVLYTVKLFVQFCVLNPPADKNHFAFNTSREIKACMHFAMHFFCNTWGSALYPNLAFQFIIQAVLPGNFPKLTTSPPRDTTRLNTLLHSPCNTVSGFI